MAKYNATRNFMGVVISLRLISTGERAQRAVSAKRAKRGWREPTCEALVVTNRQKKNKTLPVELILASPYFGGSLLSAF